MSNSEYIIIQHTIKSPALVSTEVETAHNSFKLTISEPQCKTNKKMHKRPD